MSLDVKKVSFTSSMLDSVKSKTFDASQSNSTSANQSNAAQIVPQAPQPPQIFAQVMPQQVITSPQMTPFVPNQMSVGYPNLPSAKPTPFEYIGAGLALVAAGLSTAALIRSGKSSKIANEQSSKLSKEIGTKLDTGLKDIQQETKTAIETIKSSVDGEASARQNLIEHYNGIIDGINKGLKEIKAAADDAVSVARAKTVAVIGKADFITHEVEVNGVKLNLASNMHGYGKYESELNEALRSEATKRMLGLTDRAKLTPPDMVTIRVPTSEFKGIASTGGMSVVPREVVANIGALINNKQPAKLIVDMPMYMGEIEHNLKSGTSTFTELRKIGNDTYQYLSNGSPITKTPLKHIGTMKLPVYTATNKTNEEVEMFVAKNMEQVVDFGLMRQYLKPADLKIIEKTIAKGKTYDNGILHVGVENIIDKQKNIIGSEIRAKIKFDTIFYKNDKFNMSGPSGVNGEINKNIYNNYTHNAGETERFTYFDKFFYEGLIKSHEFSQEQLGADIIIGNDWHTGGISAMMKLLTHAKKAAGDITDKTAEKLLNTPVFTILHNANESGTNFYQASELFNVLFGEHAAKIVPNAYMPSVEALKLPKEYELPAKCWNGLMHKDCMNPQTMVAAYSDVVIPVSGEYNKEIATKGVFGRSNFELFRLRNFISENLGDFGSKTKSMVGIANGCDRVNNTITEAKITQLADNLSIDRNKFRIYKEGDDVLEWHNHNKAAILEKVLADVANKKENPMRISAIDKTDLTGVDINTPIFSTAGRIVDQKGLDIFADSIVEFLKMNKFPDGNYPVFYAQGIGEQKYIDQILKVKEKVARSPELGGQAAANRIVFANLFSEKGRYDACKMMSDFTIMSSWFEPCGLVHKEIAANSGSVPIVNKVGGLVAGLRHKVNAIFSEFVPPVDGKESVLKTNSMNFASAMTEALHTYQDKKAFGKLIDASFKADHSWLIKDGPAQQYAQLLVDYKVLKPEVLNTFAPAV